MCGEQISSHVINYTQEGCKYIHLTAHHHMQLCTHWYSYIYIVPPAPQNVTVYRLSGNMMLVLWNQISLAVSRGLILNYLVVYHIRDMEGNSTEVMVPSTHDSIVITGLDSAQEYVVSVSAVTSAGRGNASSPSILSILDSPPPVSVAGFTVTTTAIIAALVGIILILLATIIVLLM